MTGPLLTMTTSSLLNLCNETGALLEPQLLKQPSPPTKPLYTSLRSAQTSLSQLHAALSATPPTALDDALHAEVQSVLASASAALHAASRLAARFKAADEGGALERSWRAWRLGSNTAAAELDRVEKTVEASVAALGLAATLVQRWDRPRAREGLLVLLRGQAGERSRGGGARGGGAAVASSGSSVSCELSSKRPP